MNVIIAGSRTFNDYPHLRRCCYGILKGWRDFSKQEIVCYCGMAPGADILGLNFATENKLKVKEFPADWKNLGNKAGICRNMKMAETADMLIAFWDGKSRGTKHMVDHGIFVGLEVHLFRF